jgi:hypothetical protein
MPLFGHLPGWPCRRFETVLELARAGAWTPPLPARDGARMGLIGLLPCSQQRAGRPDQAKQMEG